MMDDKITKLNVRFSAQETGTKAVIRTLNDCLKDIATEENFNPQKVLILTINDTDQNYTVNWFQGGMKMSECISTIEIAKILFMKEMGYIDK